ncbi:MAG: protoheme IX farnesyltransferase [Thaumarchaeota archaeon]|nr:protoheme IX farnesyltransferase [Nitrososphaerota archaeon]
MLKTGLGTGVKTYWEVTKPKIWYLLVFTAFMASLIAYSVHDITISPLTLILVITSVMAGSAAANTLTNYIDRDIDAKMERTRSRPIPSGRISPRNALYYGLTLAGISIVLAYFINIWALGLMAFGLFDNVIVYSKWLKRRSLWNIILGGFSGGAPALIGYVAVTTTTIELGLVLAGLSFLWIPTHIWSLALHIREDYARANVPMLPVVKSESTSVRVIAGTTLMMVLFSVLPFFMNTFGWIYLGVASVLGAIIIAMSISLLVKPTEKKSWTLFKFSSPYLALLFIAMYIDAIVF